MKIVDFAVTQPKRVITIMVLFTLALMMFIPQIKIDTDPENMLAEDEEVRVLHNQLKKRYNMHDIIVVGVINDEHPNGVFNQQSLTNIHEITTYILGLQEAKGEQNQDTSSLNSGLEKEKVVEYEGVISRDVMAPSNIDHIEPIGLGTLKFDWLMKSPPQSEEEALEIKERLLSNEMFKNTIVSEDARAICLYVPISSKDISHEIAGKIRDKVEGFNGVDKYHITGLPVAEDTFGTEMFIQMAITAPAAMLCIFILMLFFFKKVRLILSPMVVAMISVICTMGLLIATGNTVHIMSSMIPIFVMPIAVLDSIHILSEFFDVYPESKDRKIAIQRVMAELFRPMLFTSLTSAAGFASLALTPIPPVQVFGIFVAFGILLAWLLTITFIPAYIMLMSEESLKNFGLSEEGKSGWLLKLLHAIKGFTSFAPRSIVMGSIVLLAIAAYGINMIQINDNPVKWFTPDHPIRVADKELNEHFGGTYMAYLSLTGEQMDFDLDQSKSPLLGKINQYLKGADSSHISDSDIREFISSANDKGSHKDWYSALANSALDKADESETDGEAEAWEDVAGLVEVEALEQTQIFKRPDVLEYTMKLEDYLLKEGGVGKINSLSKLITKINKELHEGEESEHKLPESLPGVGQCIISYQNSHIPERLQHCVDSDFNGLNLWLQLKSGDNKDMEKTIAAVEKFFKDNPPPLNIDYDWFGLTYINVIWQRKMVEGMLKAFIGSFIVVFLMMTFLFRSIKWAALCMLPLSFTIALIYGVIGLIGKDYDMPVAVLSSLALGLAVDFSIHFLVRARQAIADNGGWKASIDYMFGEPSRAISRNVIVIAVGFLPLLFSNLVPYKTVGILLASILTISGLVTLILLPSCIHIFEKYLIKKNN